VVDSTQLTAAMGEAAMAQQWAVHDRVARDLLRVWRGVEIDKSDGLFLLFEDVADAVAYAAAYHEALSRLDMPFAARAGIHVGPVILRRNAPEDIAYGAKAVEVDGFAVVVASRLMAIAAGGQTLHQARLVARAPRDREAFPRARHADFGFVKGIAEPVDVYEVVRDARQTSSVDSRRPTGVHGRAQSRVLWAPVREIPTKCHGGNETTFVRTRPSARRPPRRSVSTEEPASFPGCMGWAAQARHAWRAATVAFSLGRVTLAASISAISRRLAVIDAVAFRQRRSAWGWTLGRGDRVEQLGTSLPRAGAAC
jgi:class 3 adenylate cyclase